MVLDSEREVMIGLGRDFSKTLLGRSQVFMTSSTCRYLGVEPNGQDEVELVIDVRNYLSLFLDTNQELTSDDIEKIIRILNLNINFNQEITITGSDLFNTTQIEGK